MSSRKPRPRDELLQTAAVGAVSWRRWSSPTDHPPWPCGALLPQVFRLCERESSTSPAHAARPELLEGGHPAPHLMDFESILSPPPLFSFFSGFSQAQMLNLGRMGYIPPQAVSQRQSDSHLPCIPTPRKKPPVAENPLPSILVFFFHTRGMSLVLPPVQSQANRVITFPGSEPASLHPLNLQSLSPAHIHFFCITSSQTPYVLLHPQDFTQVKNSSLYKISIVPLYLTLK